MLISYRWLQRHVDLTDVSPERVCELFTMHTAEVEGLEPFAPVLSDVVVGHVLERASRLSLCRCCGLTENRVCLKLTPRVQNDPQWRWLVQRPLDKG